MNELEQAIAAIKTITTAFGPIRNDDFGCPPEVGIAIAAVLNAVATGQLVPSQTWQPIETAPKDGTRILAFIPPYGASTAHFAEDVAGERGFTCHSVLYRKAQPTHWMPLPATPAPEVAE